MGFPASITIILVVVNCLVSFLAFQNRALQQRLIFNAYVIHQRGQWYRFITSGFIHADWMHLIVNMFVLYTFGQIVETDYAEIFADKGTYYYLLLYFGGLAISIAPTYAKQKENPGYNSLGASGAVASVMFAFILFHPMENLYLYGLIRLPGILFGALYLGYCYWAGKKQRDFINHDAHFWGALFGFAFTIILKPAVIQFFINQLPFLHHAL
jgi:membrane associated rhomboid family serine protease